MGIYGLAEGVRGHVKLEEQTPLVAGMFVTAIKLMGKRYGDEVETLIMRRLIEFKLMEKHQEEQQEKIDPDAKIEDLIKQAAKRGSKRG